MTLAQKILSVIILCVVGSATFYIGRETAPPNIKEVVKVEHQNDIVTVVKEVVRPDGTKETETTKTDKSVITKEESKTITLAKALNQVTIGSDFNFRQGQQEYSIAYQRRVLGNIWAGASGNSNGSVGLLVGLEF